MGLWPGAQEWSTKRDRYLRDNPAKDDNLLLYHVPKGDFNSHFAEIEIQRRQHMASIIIVNSWEFCCRTARHRDDLVFHLLNLCDMGCTVIVFTQEEKRKIDKQARGPLALLRMQSDQVLDEKIFVALNYAEPVGSTYANEDDYYDATGQSGPEYFKRIRALFETGASENDLPDRVMAAEIHDTVHDDIELPKELVDGGVYSMDGELVCVNEMIGKQTMNQYTVHQNSYAPQSVAQASACAPELAMPTSIIVHC